MLDLHVCIVDDHCDVVPFIHSYWRAKKVKHGEPAILVHFDAHPDLSLPSTLLHENTTSSWNDPSHLYDVLSDEGGIAEFILPLFTTNILTSMIWIRSPWSHQLPDGHSTFVVQDVSKYRKLYNRKKSKVTINVTPSVSLKETYYIDEGVYSCISCRNSSSCRSCPVALHVQSLELKSMTEVINKPNFWILDICLDYFATYNPFLVDLRKAVIDSVATHDIERNVELRDLIDLPLDSSTSDAASKIISVIVNALQRLSFRCLDGNEEMYASDLAAKLRARSYVSCSSDHDDLNQCYCEVCSLPDNQSSGLVDKQDDEDGPIQEDCECSSMKRVRHHSLSILSKLLQSANSTPSEDLIEKFLELYSPSHRPQARMFVRLLPFTADFVSIIDKAQLLLLLPHHESTLDEVTQMIARMESYLTSSFSNCPSFVTISRSHEDNYTPSFLVDDIQAKVVAMIDKLYCSGSLGCKMYVHDMCEGAHAKSYNLFRNKLHLQSDHLPTAK